MITLVLQSIVTVLLLAFSVLAFAVSKRLAGESSQQQGWLITGVVMAAYSVNKAIQGIWGVSAFSAGAEHPIFVEYLRVAPLFNHSRTTLIFVLYAGLAWLSLRGPLRRPWVVAIGSSCVGLLIGGFYGSVEGSLQAVRHYPSTAIVDVLGFMVLGSVLLVGMIRDTVDRFLWFALAMYGFTSIVGVLFLTAGAWVDTPGVWSPPFWLLELFRLVFAAGMAGFAYARYRAAVRGKPVRGLLPRNEPLGRPTLA